MIANLKEEEAFLKSKVRRLNIEFGKSVVEFEDSIAKEFEDGIELKQEEIIAEFEDGIVLKQEEIIAECKGAEDDSMDGCYNEGRLG